MTQAAAVSPADPRASAWVAANAGAGKTKILCDRVLRLLLSGSPPGRILCLTYTRAAAAEMQHRLHDALGSWAMADDAALIKILTELEGGAAPTQKKLHRARTLFAHVLDAAEGVRIHTLHAFCQSVLRRFPLEAGVAPHFSLMDDRVAKHLLAQAVHDVLARPAEEGGVTAALAAIAARVQEDEFHGLLTTLVNQRHAVQDLFDAPGAIDASLAVLSAALGMENAPPPLRTTPQEINTLRQAAEWLGTGGATDQKLAAALRDWLASDQGESAAITYARAWVTEEGEIKKNLGTKAVRAEFPALAAVIEAESTRAVAYYTHAMATHLLDGTRHMLTLGQALFDRYAALKDLHGGMDYHDLVQHTTRLLRKPGISPWVLFKLDGGIDHILVDEAQDTSAAQWAIVEALTGEFFTGDGTAEKPRTLFVVGDEKQSIFRFQGAQPKEFGRMQDVFHARARGVKAAFHVVPLQRSYRSTPAVLSVVDAVFGQPLARAGLTYHDIPVRHIPHRALAPGRVELWPLILQEEEAEISGYDPPALQRSAPPPHAVMAERIAVTLRGWLDTGRVLPAKNRLVRAGDVLILVRSRGALMPALIQALKRHHIPVAGADRLRLNDHIAVMDMLALARFLLLPEDDLSLACILKSPLVGMEEETLFMLAEGRGDTPLWRRVQGMIHAHPAIHAAAEMLQGLLAKTDFMPPFELLSEVLEVQGARARFAARLGDAAHDPLDELLRLALEYEQAETPSLQGFVAWMEADDSDIKRESERARDEVRIMTIHGAKGLQAPIVFLPDTGPERVKHESFHVMHWGEMFDIPLPLSGGGLGWGLHHPHPNPLPGRERGSLPLFLWPRGFGGNHPFAQGVKGMTATAAGEESRRLLYVALTRAEDELYIGGYAKKQEIKPDSWYRLIEAGMQTVATAATVVLGGETLDVLRVEEGYGDSLPPCGDVDNSLPLLGGGGRGLHTSPACITNEEFAGDVIAKEDNLHPICVENNPHPTPPPKRGREYIPSFLTHAPPTEPAPTRPLTPSRMDVAVPDALSVAEGLRLRERGIMTHRMLQILPGVLQNDRILVADGFLSRHAPTMPAAERAQLRDEVLAVLNDSNAALFFGPDSLAEVPISGVVPGPDGTPLVVNGQVDRLAVTEDAVWVVDYKTGRHIPLQPSEIPAAYTRQMAAYVAVLQRIYPDRPVRAAFIWTAGPRLLLLP